LEKASSEFGTRLRPEDILQGYLGDCYLLSAISALATKPALVARLFDINEIIPESCYAIWLNINGEWKEYILDDYFPVCDEGEGISFCFARSKADEIWVNLLEKAYAKAYGSYARLDGGWPIEALKDLTGAPYDCITMQI
jgi:calpain-15